MKKPLVGIIGNSYKIDNKYPAQGSGTINIEAIAEVSGALPVIIFILTVLIINLLLFRKPFS